MSKKEQASKQEKEKEKEAEEKSFKVLIVFFNLFLSRLG